MQPTVAVQIKKHSHKSQHISIKAVSPYFPIKIHVIHKSYYSWTRVFNGDAKTLSNDHEKLYRG